MLIGQQGIAQLDITPVLSGLVGKKVRVTGNGIEEENGIVGILEVIDGGLLYVVDMDNDPMVTVKAAKFISDKVLAVMNEQFLPKIVLR